MSRLTKRVDGEARENHDDDVYAPKSKGGWQNGNRECMEKLAAYEDTDLTPEEIKGLLADRDRWKIIAEVLKSAQRDCDNCAVDGVRWKKRAEALEKALRDTAGTEPEPCDTCIHHGYPDSGPEPCAECYMDYHWEFDEVRFTGDERDEL